MEEKLIDKTTLVLAKEKGFSSNIDASRIDNYFINCEIQKYLREVHKIKVLVTHSPSGMYNYEIYKWDFNNDKGIWERIGNISHYETYELALNEGLKHSLTLIK
jgi:hypothetical protein